MSVRAPCSNSVGSGTIGTPRPLARPRPKETPARSTVNERGPVATATLLIWLDVAIRRSSESSSALAGVKSSLPPVSGSIRATAAVAADVSMTKITCCPDHAAVAAEMLDLEQGRTVDLEPVAPFHDDRALLGELLQAQVAQLRAVFDPIEVDMRELYPARVDAHQLKGRARDWRWRARTLRDAAHERRLASAELAGQEHHVAGSQPLA